MAPIQTIYIACFKHDVRFTRILVASIRKYYPDLPIKLIKDEFYGPFDTSEIEKHWGVSILPLEHNRFSWGFSKLEALFLPERERCLVLDSDTLFTGPLLKILNPQPEDFIVVHEDPSPAFLLSHYFDLEAVRVFDSDFEFPGYSFNTGQWVGTTGIFKREDLSRWIEWTYPPSLKQPEAFKLGEQGFFNYLLMKHAQVGKVTVKRVSFMEVGNNPAVERLTIEDLDADRERPFLIHWCGLKREKLSDMPRGDLLLHFERIYYSRVPMGALKMPVRNLTDFLVRKARAGRRLLKALPGNVRALPFKVASRKVEKAVADTIIAGPFRGMRYVKTSVCSALHPKMLGTYESELRETTEALLARAFKTVIDVGAAEGYYAVGWAFRDKQARVIAFEATATGREQIALMAQANKVSDRVSIKGFCEPEALKTVLQEHPGSLLIMDVEGAEEILLDPQTIPPLKNTTVLVELHEFVRRGVGDLIRKRFVRTHRITEFISRDRTIDESPVRSALFDRWIERLLREGRPEVMQWFLMEPL